MNFAKPDNKRQKIVAVLLVVIGIVLLWQLYGLFAVDKNLQQTAVATAPAASSAHQPAMAVTPAATAAQLAQNAAAPANDGGTAVDPNNSQSEYLRLVNEYQMAQLQRMIAEDNEAIAIAKQNAAKATTETAKLMGGGNFTPAGNSSAQGNNNDYQLVYTGQQNDGSWSATLKKNGQNIDVIVGTQLSDGPRVLSIDDNGVLLQRGDVKKLVTFAGVSQTTMQSGDEQAAPMKTSQTNNIAGLPKLAQAENTSTVITTPALPVKKMTTQHETTSDANSSVLPLPVKEKAEKAEKAEAAIKATPDNPTAPEKTVVATTSKAVKHDDKAAPVKSDEAIKPAKKHAKENEKIKKSANKADEKNKDATNAGKAVKIEELKGHSIVLEDDKATSKPVIHYLLLLKKLMQYNQQ